MAGRRFERGAIPVVLHPERLDEPLRWRKPRRVFVCSLADLFHEDVPDEFIERVFLTMVLAERHSFQALIKRPHRMQALLNDSGTRNFIVNRAMALRVKAHRKHGWEGPMPFHHSPWPLPNVWLGVSVENQCWADERIPLLRDTAAAVRFLSCEPLLGPLELAYTCGCDYGMCPKNGQLHGIDWVIVGGESGPGRDERKLVYRGGLQQVATRPPLYVCSASTCPSFGAYVTPAEMELHRWHPKPSALDWVRSIRDQCIAAGVPFFFKQWGGPRPTSGGRLLDGRTWDEMPLAQVVPG